jgi:hypothetical protein
MPTYNYCCSKECTLSDLEKLKKEITTESTLMISKDGILVWEEKHSMSATPKIKCPVCGAKAVKTFLCTHMPVCYTRGYGYLDKAGCRRDMDLFKLQKGEDPYGHMRQPGEVDHIKDQLRRGKKSKPKYFT